MLRAALPLLLTLGSVAATAAEPLAPMDQAIALCSFHIGGDGSIQLPDSVKWYKYTDPSAARQLGAMGFDWAVGNNTSELPELVLRFAKTQPAAAATGMDPAMYQYWSVTPQIWVVGYPKVKACDIMVTGAADPLADRDRALATLAAQGWAGDVPSGKGDDAFWSAAMAKADSRLRIEGVGRDGPRDGVQMDLQFTRATTDKQ